MTLTLTLLYCEKGGQCAEAQGKFLGKHFLTTSYVSDAMRALEPLAKEKGVVMINECGVDPGTDHMSAMRVFDHVLLIFLICLSPYFLSWA